MGKVYFEAQKASKEILTRVSNLCAECYYELKEGEEIYYDRQEYRYVCKDCEEKLNIKTKEEISLYTNTLF